MSEGPGVTGQGTIAAGQENITSLPSNSVPFVDSGASRSHNGGTPVRSPSRPTSEAREGNTSPKPFHTPQYLHSPASLL